VTLTPAPAGGSGDDPWTTFTAALRREVAQLPEESFLVLRDPADESHLAQFWQAELYLRAEVPGDEGAGGSPEQDARALSQLGFTRASLQDGGNWRRTIDWPATTAEYESLIDAVVVALRDVQGVPSPAVLIYHAWGYDCGHRRVDLPGVTPDPEKY
jgi:hypothetical protein